MSWKVYYFGEQSTDYTTHAQKNQAIHAAHMWCSRPKRGASIQNPQREHVLSYWHNGVKLDCWDHVADDRSLSLCSPCINRSTPLALDHPSPSTSQEELVPT